MRVVASLRAHLLFVTLGRTAPHHCIQLPVPDVSSAARSLELARGVKVRPMMELLQVLIFACLSMAAVIMVVARYTELRDRRGKIGASKQGE